MFSEYESELVVLSLSTSRMPEIQDLILATGPSGSGSGSGPFRRILNASRWANRVIKNIKTNVFRICMAVQVFGFVEKKRLLRLEGAQFFSLMIWEKANVD